MKRQSIYRSNWAMPLALLIIFSLVGCQPSAPTLPSEPSSVPEASSIPEASAVPEVSSTPEAPLPTPATVETTPTSPPAQGESPLYQDTFTSKGTGWDDAKLGDYFVGYHGPEWYHIEIDSSNSKVAISEPNKAIYDNITLELQVFAVAAKTDPTGDFRYGLVFRRSGDQYYAFAVSPNTKKWEMLKVSTSGVETLKEGEDESIHDRDVGDILRVDAIGPNFFLYINDHLAAPVTDTAYTSGQVGLYGESLDSPTVHIHYDTFTIRDLKLDLICSIEGTVYVRSGPGKTYAQTAVLSDGDTVNALGKSPNLWIEIKVEGSDAPGWVSYSEGYMSCTPTVDIFPVISP